MALLCTIILTLLVVNLNICFSATIDTSQPMEYMSYTISCPDGEDCTVRCDANAACFNSLILCPTNYSCDIQCIANFAGAILNVCANATINCIRSTQCDVSCLNPNNHPLYSANACKDTIIHWPDNKQYTLACGQGAQCTGVHIQAPSDNDPFDLDCDIAQCQESIVHCPDNSSCSIKCEQVNSCLNAIIHCGTSPHSECSISCASSNACAQMVVFGTGIISKCNGLSTCKAATFPQPPSTIDYSLFCGGSNSACADADIKCPSNAACHITCDAPFACDNAVITWPTSGVHDTSLTCADGACTNVNLPPSKNPTAAPVASPTSLTMGPTISISWVSNTDDSQSKNKHGFDMDSYTMYIFVALAVALCFCCILNLFLCCRPKKQNIKADSDSCNDREIMESVMQEINSPTLGPLIPGLPKISSLMFWEKEGVATAVKQEEINNAVLASDELMKHEVEDPDMITVGGEDADTMQLTKMNSLSESEQETIR